MIYTQCTFPCNITLNFRKEHLLRRRERRYLLLPFHCLRRVLHPHHHRQSRGKFLTGCPNHLLAHIKGPAPKRKNGFESRWIKLACKYFRAAVFMIYTKYFVLYVRFSYTFIQQPAFVSSLSCILSRKVNLTICSPFYVITCVFDAACFYWLIESGLVYLV